MKVSILQLDTAWLDKEANLSKIKTALSTTGCDLFLLPEMFNTGYIMNPKDGAESLDGNTLNTLVDMLQNTNKTIGGSIPTIIENRYYNTFIFVNKNGLIASYHKIHLFAPAGEAERYTSGNDDIVFDLNNITIKPLICYDLRFPYCSFNKNVKPYDFLIYSANWPKGRIGQWEKLLMARAIENQCYVIGINRVGQDANGYEYPGKSMVVDFKGDVLLSLDEREQVGNVTLDFDAMKSYREKFPFLNDAILQRDKNLY